MSVKSIIVPLDGSDASFRVLDTALIISRRFDAKITGIHVRIKADDLPFELDYVSAGLKQTVIEKADRKSTDESRIIRDQFTKFCGKYNIEVGDSITDADVGAVWQEESGNVAEVLIRYGRLCDVIATARPSRTKGSLLRSPVGENTEALLMRAGRPVLMVPPGWPARKVERAAVAWNESLEVSRALAMTMPWLGEMDEVDIIVARKRERSVPALAEYLSLHGVKSKARFLPPGIKPVGQAILDCCEENGIEMLVVGGFSHTRSRQLVFGGVTRFLLANSNIITVMVH